MAKKRPLASSKPDEKETSNSEKQARQLKSTNREDPDPDSTILEVVDEEGLLLIGQARVRVLDGALDILGRCLLSSSEPIDVACSAQIGGPIHLIPLPLPADQPLPLATGQRCLLHLQSLPLENKQESQLRKATFAIHRLNARGAPAFRPLPAVHEIGGASSASGSISQLRIAVAGSKNVGKSTFGRLLVNHLLNLHSCVAFLDTDLGQPELTVPGLMSVSMLTQPLLGPPHLHQRQPELSFFIGGLSPEAEPQLCIRAVQALYGWYCQNAAVLGAGSKHWPPLVINTHGWIQGMGLEVLSEILKIVQPSHTVMLQSGGARRNLPSDAFWLPPEARSSSPPEILILPGLALLQRGGNQPAMPAFPEATDQAISKPLSPVDLRAMSWLAFALRCCGSTKMALEFDAGHFASAAKLLAANPPLTISFSNLKIKLPSADISSADAAAALNCSIVGLLSSGSIEEHQETRLALPVCVGVGIVRAVDASKGQLYILTDVPEEQLDCVTTLQVGKLELPPALLQTAGLMSPYLCLWSISTEGSGAGAIKSRNNLARLGQF